VLINRKIKHTKIRSKQNGFSITGYLSTLIATGAITTAMLPSIHNIVDTADYNALKHAKRVLINSMQVNYQIHKIRGGNSLEINGQVVALRFGFPYANKSSLNQFASLESFEMDNMQDMVRIWSPGRQYCMTYRQASARKGAHSRPELSEIMDAAKDECD